MSKAITNTPKLTEERLRTWLDSNQPERERLCAAILPLLGPYKNVVPRRPKGGPDGSRDLEATYLNSELAWIAVGFRNQVSDSPADKNWVKRKFKKDVDDAKRQNCGLSTFAFFTNVDLTPADVRKLKQYAASKSISHCDVFHRERLRTVLDQVEGMPYRLQYLQIEMSIEDQTAFFNLFGTDLRLLLERQHQTVDARLHALDFWMASMRPLRQFWIIIELDKEYAYDELGHFRFWLSLRDSYDDFPVIVAGRDRVIRVREKDQTITTTFGPHLIVKSQYDPKPKVFAPKMFADRMSRLVLSVNLAATGAFERLDDLNHTMFDVAVTEALRDRIASFSVIGNRYVLADLAKFQRGLLRYIPGREPAWPSSPWLKSPFDLQAN